MPKEIKGLIRVNKRNPVRCSVCNTTDVIYSITYRDTENPAHKDIGGIKLVVPNRAAYSCTDCLIVATAKLLKDAGSVKDEM